MLLSVARLSPIKDLATFVRAIALLREQGHDLDGAIVGGELAATAAMRRRSATLITRMNLSATIAMVGAVPPDDVVDWYRRSFAHVNLCPKGALDKAALEAMACGKPSLVANDAYADVLGPWHEVLSFGHGDAPELALRLETLLRTPAGGAGDHG